MGKSGPRPIKYVCSGMVSGKVFSKEYEISSSEDASSAFEKEFNVVPDFIHGPYHSKRAGTLDNARVIEFSNVRYKAIYKDWIVVASLLKSPSNSAYLLFDKRVDGKKSVKPAGTFIVKLDEIKEIK